MDLFDKEFNKRFVLFRKKYLGTQKEAAEVCGCSQKHISDIEAGLKTISVEMIHNLHKKKHMHLEWFFGSEKSPMVKKPEGRETITTNIVDLKSEIEIMKKYIEQLQSVMKKIARDVYAK